MKMADNAAVLLSFQNNCEAINSNCVEVPSNHAGDKSPNRKADNDDINIKENHTNQTENQSKIVLDNEQTSDKLLSAINVVAEEEDEEMCQSSSVDDSLNVSTIELIGNSLKDNNQEILTNENDSGVSFKEDNANEAELENELLEYTTEDFDETNEIEESDLIERENEKQLNEDTGHEIEHVEEEEAIDDVEEIQMNVANDGGNYMNGLIDNDGNEVDEIEGNNAGSQGRSHFKIHHRRWPIALLMANKLKKRSIKCLNKMQIMEDVREGCNVQPSSPGHAEQRNQEELTKSKSNNTNDTNINPKSSYTELSNDKLNATIKQEADVEIKEEEPQFIEETECSNTSSNDNNSNPVNNKRKSIEISEESPAKRLRNEIQENFLTRDKILNEFIEIADCSNVDQIQSQTEQVLAEIRTLNELAKEKEREWNNIIHLKKLKEELLLRMQRKKQTLLLERTEDHEEEPIRNHSPQSILKANLLNTAKSQSRISQMDKTKQYRQQLQQQQFLQKTQEINGMDYRQGRQRNVVDVQSIIADYRQRHPEVVPRRGRRIRHSQSDNGKNSNVLNFASMTFGSGSQMRQSNESANEMSVYAINGSSRTESSMDQSSFLHHTPSENTPFKDMLVHFSRLSQSERNELIHNAIKPPPPYPEVTVHPVPTTTNTNNNTNTPQTNSLLHGILTKSPTKSSASKTTFSPTLARLLTAPERAANVHNNIVSSTPNLNHNNGAAALLASNPNMSISEILSSSKARNEITITPVNSQYDAQGTKSRNVQIKEEDETEDSVDRLVIDETNESGDRKNNTDNNSEAGDEIPQCQGCNQKTAQFVCAGCGNQWYCSRDCQVAAWDEHSEACSG